ncbi:MAG: YbhB/YbcL family Raf kinase inhibitor-like protein [Coriobacteriaceae bacterium]|nr:YbhB/YbcL family Raf kinase inhibitor-like protein [Coriobacteriaceae bacterium]
MGYVGAAKRIGVACALVALAALGFSCARPSEAPIAPQGVGSALVLSSPAFAGGAAIPGKYASVDAGGQDISPPLAWAGVPDTAKSLALVVVDRHRIANDWIHWMVVDIPPDTDGLGEGSSGTELAGGSREFANTFGETGWGGPAPPPGSGPHTYEFLLYALDTDKLDLPEKTTLDEFEQAVAGHVLAVASLSGTFVR